MTLMLMGLFVFHQNNAMHYQRPT